MCRQQDSISFSFCIISQVMYMQLSCYAGECNKLFRFISFSLAWSVWCVWNPRNGTGREHWQLCSSQRGASPQPGTRPITFKRILVFSTYLQSAVQTLINDSVIARGKSWQREGWQLTLPAFLAGSQTFLLQPRRAGCSIPRPPVISSNYSSGSAAGGF